MAEDLPQPTSNEAKMSRSQSTVARVLQDGVVQDSPGRRREEGVSEGVQDEDRSVEVDQHPLQSDSRHGEAERMGSPVAANNSFVSRSNTSPDVYITSPPLSSGLKALKCPMCDYMTTDKSNFRRHKRLHMRNNPMSVLRCGKCDFSTAQPRKIREHYIQDHGEEYGPPLPALPDAVRIQTYGDNHHFGGRHMEIPHNQCGQGTMPMTGTIHTLLGAPPSMQFGRAEPQLLANCVTQYRPYEVQPQGDPQDNQLASDYLRSIVSNIITTHHTPRVPATSTITSSSFYLPPPVESTQTLSPLSHPFSSVQSRADEPQSENVVKVKVEPVDCDGASDVSSSATPVCTSGPRHLAPPPRRLNMDATPVRADRNNEATSSGDTGFTSSSEAVGCRPDVRSEPVETSAHRPARDIRPVADSRDSRVMIQSRDSRVMVQSRDSRLMMQSRDARFAIAKHDSQMMVDPRLRVESRDQVVIDHRDLRSVVESRDAGRLTLDIRDLRPPGDLHSGREVRSAVDSGEQRTVEPDHTRTNLDKREFRTLVPVSTHEPQPMGEVREIRPGVDIQFANLPIKTEMSTVGIQCSLPFIKTEGDAPERRARTLLVESSVQCELLSSGRRISSTRFSADCGSGEQSSMRQASKCTHCGVTFEDEVIFSIHIGCHSHTDPFVCNVCGKQCYNKYGFYSHIMRGHRL